MRRGDVMIDAGHSLNPAVDIGQVPQWVPPGHLTSSADSLFQDWLRERSCSVHVQKQWHWPTLVECRPFRLLLSRVCACMSVVQSDGVHAALNKESAAG